MPDVNAVKELYPQCTQPGIDPADVYVAVRATVKGSGGLGYASTVRLTFGMALWTAIVIHVIGVEVYVRMHRLWEVIISPSKFFGIVDPQDGVFESTQAGICARAG
jgi:hypothetical protein